MSKIYHFPKPPLGEGNGNPLQYSCLENPMDGGTWWAAVHGVVKSRTRLSNFTFTFHFHALEKAMATHSSVLAWRIPGMGEPGGLPSLGSHRVGHGWSDLAAIFHCMHILHLYPVLCPWTFKLLPFLAVANVLQWILGCMHLFGLGFSPGITGWEGRGGINWEIGIDIYIQLSIYL